MATTTTPNTMETTASPDMKPLETTATDDTETGYSRHELSACFPPLSDAEFSTLKDDIKANGLRYPILVHDDQILDGWCRYQACRELGVVPRFEEYTGANPASVVISLNLKRRHLTESQRTMIAAKLATRGRGRPSKENPPSGGISTAEAAALLNVKPRSVQRAKIIHLHGTADLVEAVTAGNMSVTAAEQQVRSRDSDAPSPPPKAALPRRRKSPPLERCVNNLIEHLGWEIEDLDAVLRDDDEEGYTRAQAATWRKALRRERRKLEQIERRRLSREALAKIERRLASGWTRSCS